jgi:penicillin amidase
MDLQRRQPAGELSGLVGPRAIDVDQEMRVHRFRDVAHRALERRAVVPKRARGLCDGVNAGLNALGAPPFEYLVLRATPEPWTPEDSILTVLAMFNTLQGRQALFEQSHGALRDTLPEPMFRFLSTAGSEWEHRSLESDQRPPIPGPTCSIFADARDTEARNTNTEQRQTRREVVRASVLPCPRDEASSSAATTGRSMARTARSGAIVANDMHLSIGVPIIWYRASMVFRSAEPATSASPASRFPASRLVVGSNGHVAWGFTNTGGDWSDLVRIEPDPRDPKKYLTPTGRSRSTSSKKPSRPRAAVEDVPIRWTIWGPIVWKDARGREYAQRWVAHDATALASDITKPERARSVDDLLPPSPASASQPERADGRHDRPHRVDDRRTMPKRDRPRRHDPGIVGRRHESLGRLPHAAEFPASSIRRRAHLDRERAGRRRRDARGDRRGRLCRRHPRAMIRDR